MSIFLSNLASHDCLETPVVQVQVKGPEADPIQTDSVKLEDSNENVERPIDARRKWRRRRLISRRRHAPASPSGEMKSSMEEAARPRPSLASLSDMSHMIGRLRKIITSQVSDQATNDAEVCITS